MEQRHPRRSLGLGGGAPRRAVAALAVAAAILAAAGDAVRAPDARAQSAQTHLTDRGQVYTFREVSEALVCQCGCNMILYVCNHVNCPSAYPFRDTIEAMIERGSAKDEIVARFVADHGEVVLSAPTAEGFNLAAWVTPFVMLLLGGVFLASFFRARRLRAAAAPRGGVGAGAAHATDAGALASPAKSPAAADAYTARVDEELGGLRD